jgi:hypothetical protein
MYLFYFQAESESLKYFKTHFNKEKLAVDDQDERIVLAGILGGILLQSSFMEELARKNSSSLQEFINKAVEVINAKDTIMAFKKLSQKDSR